MSKPNNNVHIYFLDFNCLLNAITYNINFLSFHLRLVLVSIQVQDRAKIGYERCGKAHPNYKHCDKIIYLRIVLKRI